MTKLLKNNLSDFLLAIVVIVVFLAAVPVFTYAYFAKDLESQVKIINKKDTGVVLLDRHDKPFFAFYQGKTKNFVPLSEISPLTREAVVAIEDKEFYKHHGFSLSSIVRSAIENVKEKELAQGGSTITQQLVKNTLLTSKKNLLRKYQEIVLASEVEKRYTKDQILEMYLNSIYFGNGATGISSAANIYFGKEAKDLSLAESAYIAGVLPAPNKFGSDRTLGTEREHLVLEKMKEQGYITEDEYNQALSEKLVFKNKDENDLTYRAPHFALMVRDFLIQKYGEEFISTSGLKIKTTLDLSMQDYAEKAVQQGVEKLKKNKVTNGAAVVMDPKTGEVLSLVGSVDWNNNEFGKVNIATSLRQPGSSFKPIVYIAGLEKGIITPATLLKDEPITYDIKPGTYSPHNYDGQYHGNVPARFALGNSYNIPAVEVMNQVTVPGALDMAKRLGITTLEDPSRYGLSLVLGAGEVKMLDMGKAYSTFANSGVKNDPAFVLSISDKYGHEIYSYTPDPQPVLKPEYAFLISSMLSDTSARQPTFGNALTISKPAAVKTGTTQNYRDAWTIGYTPSLTVVVWVGNNDGKPMDKVAGALGPAPIWRNLMEHYLQGKPQEAFAPPQNVIALAICKSSGLLAHSEASQGGVVYKEYFYAGTQPTRLCPTPAPTPSPDIASADQNQNQDQPTPPERHNNQPPPRAPESDLVQVVIKQEKKD